MSEEQRSACAVSIYTTRHDSELESDELLPYQADTETEAEFHLRIALFHIGALGCLHPYPTKEIDGLKKYVGSL